MSKQNKRRRSLEARHSGADLMGGLAEIHPALAVVGLVLGAGLILARVGQQITRIRLGRRMAGTRQPEQKGASQE